LAKLLQAPKLVDLSPAASVSGWQIFANLTLQHSQMPKQTHHDKKANKQQVHNNSINQLLWAILHTLS
jgi:hypothetical protein